MIIFWAALALAGVLTTYLGALMDEEDLILLGAAEGLLGAGVVLLALAL